jgi:DNA-directed RNA polymerase subunit RPC12/RpoP
MFGSFFTKKKPEDVLKSRVFKCRNCGEKITAIVGYVDLQPPSRCPFCGSTKGFAVRRVHKATDEQLPGLTVLPPEIEEQMLKTMEAAERVEKKSAHMLHMLDLKAQGKSEELKVALEDWEKMKKQGMD